MIDPHDLAVHATSRRIFLRRSLPAVAATCGLLALRPRIRAEGDQPAAPRGEPRFGFTTYQWGQDWDVPTLLQNLQKAQVWGTELRTSSGYAHQVELTLSADERREVRKRFADSPIQLVGLATGERFDWPDPEKLKSAIENAKGFLKLSHDLGSSGIRVFPNQFHPDIPRDKTIAQIAQALRELGPSAADYGQEVRLEAHGSAGELTTIAAIMEQCPHPQVRVKLNSDNRDVADFVQRFNLVRDRLGQTLHLHNLKETSFPYALQTKLLVEIGWTGWALLEVSDKVPDRVQALIEQREIWEQLMARARRGK
jgi:hypothetical protein